MKSQFFQFAIIFSNFLVIFRGGKNRGVKLVVFGVIEIARNILIYHISTAHQYDLSWKNLEYFLAHI